MKIAINAWFYNKINTGSGQYLRYLIPALAKLDSRLEIVLVVPSFAWDAADDIVWGKSVSVHPVSLSAGNFNKVKFEQSLFPKIAKKLKADVAHVPYWGSALAPQIPTVVTIHDIIPRVLPNYRGGAAVRLYTALVSASAANANLVLADSDASRNDILRLLNLPAAKVRKVFLAPAPRFQPAETWAEIEAVTDKYNLPEVFALYMGGFDVRKNVAALLHAWTFIAPGLGEDVKLVLAGKIPQTDSTFFPNPLKLAKDLGIEAHVIAPGWIDEADKPALYSAARLFVYPSRYEGFGLPVLEAMACGTPVVTGNVSSLPELVDTAAFQIAPDDTKSMASSIISLTIQENTHNDMANKAYQRAQKFSWQITARQTLQAYKDVAR